VKLQNLSKRKQELLAKVFAEAKWLYNSDRWIEIEVEKQP